MGVLQFKPFRIRKIKSHLGQINNLLKDPQMSIENLQDLNKYFEFMAARTKDALAEAVGKLMEEKKPGQVIEMLNEEQHAAPQS